MSVDCESKVPCVAELDMRGRSVRAGLAFSLGMTEKEEARPRLRCGGQASRINGDSGRG